MYRANNKTKEEQTADPSKYPQGHFKDKPCRRCGTDFKPKAPSELYCSEDCRSWSTVSRRLEREYGITFDRYHEMLKEQDHLCAVCGTEGWTMAEHHNLKLVVDHCHTTGKVRGLLCHNCNRALGLLQDSKDNLSNAIEYLEGATTISSESTLK